MHSFSLHWDATRTFSPSNTFNFSLAIVNAPWRARERRRALGGGAFRASLVCMMRIIRGVKSAPHRSAGRSAAWVARMMCACWHRAGSPRPRVARRVRECAARALFNGTDCPGAARSQVRNAGGGGHRPRRARHALDCAFVKRRLRCPAGASSAIGATKELSSAG
jgi:hypothetical protein